MILIESHGSVIQLEAIAHAWVTCQPNTLHIYFIGGNEAVFTGELADYFWEEIKYYIQHHYSKSMS
jgi:hypothetical protein